MTLPAGTRIGRYEVRSLLGAGGMGEVYLAQDAALGRPVALKILPAEVAADEQPMQRFRQEARAASALDHPNIITIYEIGEAAGAHFIASEYVRGVTLRERLARGPVPLGEVLALGMQAASALSAAHEAGVVHRDVKPENVMIRPDGFVKVLDFGLAKLSEAERDAAASAEAPTRAFVQTAPGMVMGTVAYMSPEQAAGLADVDARTDVWSLGVLLYEMVAGRVPFWFEGATPTQLISMIIQRDAPPLKQFAPGVPDELSRIVMKALENSREDRYQSVTEMLVDLRRLNRQLEREAEAERSVAPEARGGGGGAPPARGAQTRAAVTQSAGARPPAGTGEVAPSHRTSSAEYLVNGVRRHKAGAAAAFALLALALTGAGYGVYRWAAARRAEPVVSFQSAKFTRLTTTGKVVGVSLSPDGRYVAHVVDDGGQQSLWVRQTAAPSDVQIVPPAAGASYRGFSFSPDGNFVYYALSGRDDRRGSLYQVPVLGGAARKLLAGISSGVTFSPDGKQIAFFRRAHLESGREDSLVVANADGTGERTLAKGVKEVLLFRGQSFSSPAWSPDGKTIAVPYGNFLENYLTVAAVSVESGELKPLTSQRWFGVRQTEWLAGGDGLLFTAQDSAGAPYQLWHLPNATGAARRVTNDLSNYRMFSLTANSDAIAVVQGEAESNVWVMPAGDSARATQVTFDKRSHTQLTWTHDGRIIYSSTAGGDVDLFLVDPRGGGTKQLTAVPGTNGYPQVTRDGRHVVFMSGRAGRPNLWRMDFDGGNETRLTDGNDLHPHLSPDGRWVVYQSWMGNNTIRKVSLDGGQPVQLTDYVAGTPAFSPDGKLIACSYQESPGATLISIAVISADGGPPLKKFPLPGEGESSSSVLRWTPDGREIVYGYLDKGVTNLWAQPVDGGRPRQITNFTSDRIFWFDFSHDGKQIALSRGTQTGDVVLIKDFR